jgi:cell wall-associated NlpC family hydrolase
MGRIKSFVLIILIGIFSCDSGRYQETISLIEQVEKAYAPDSRTALFDIRAINRNPVRLEGETNLPEAKQELLGLLQSKGLEIEDAVLLLPAADLGEKRYGLVNVSVANLRAAPSHSAELVTQALLGTPLKLLKKDRGWYLMQTPDKYLAWSNSASIVSIDDAELAEWKNTAKIIYLDTYGFSFDPVSDKRVSDLVAGSILILKNEAPDGWEVEYPDGRNAQVAKASAVDFQAWKNSITLDGNSVSEIAMELMGIPYLWGGTSTKGLDCSGFTKTVYFLQGLVLPRDASQQAQVGELVDTARDFSRLEPGDLLFFGRRNDDKSERIVHVGLWLGDHEFIHASGDVHISSLDSLDENFDRYNYNRYLRTKRISGSNTARDALIDALY